MGIQGVSIGSIAIILIIAILLFGTRRLRTIGTDLGAALKSFRKGVKDVDSDDDQQSNNKD